MSERTEALLDSFLRSDCPLLIVLAGSNGAGKSTFFDTFLEGTLPFVNADVIARTMNPDAPQPDPYASAKLAEAVRHDLLGRRTSFCMETVFSDPAGEKLAFMRDAQTRGYQVLFIWIRIENVELSMARVQQRVEEGGHDVPDEKLTARFARTEHNAIEALTFVDLAIVLDNSSVDHPFRHVETWQRGVLVERIR